MTFNEESLHSEFIFNEDLSKTPIYKLPEILTKLDLEYPDFAGMPDFKHLSVVHWDAQRNHAYVEDCKPRLSVFPTVYEAYILFKETGVVFDPSVIESHEFRTESLYENDEMQVLYGEYLFKGHNEEAQLGFQNIPNYEELYREHYRWLCTARRWVSDKNDFFNSWNFLNNHPALWEKLELSEKNPSHSYMMNTHPIFRSKSCTPNDWKRSKLTQSIVSNLECSSERKIFLNMMISGKNFKFHSLADSYEEGIVALANLLHEDYSVDGNRRIDW